MYLFVLKIATAHAATTTPYFLKNGPGKPYGAALKAGAYGCRDLAAGITAAASGTGTAGAGAAANAAGATAGRSGAGAA